MNGQRPQAGRADESIGARTFLSAAMAERNLAWGSVCPPDKNWTLQRTGMSALRRAGVAALPWLVTSIMICLVKRPSINVEEKIDKFVGRRTKTPDALSTRTSTKADSIAWRKA